MFCCCNFFVQKFKATNGCNHRGMTHVGSLREHLRMCCLGTQYMFGLQSLVCTDTGLTPGKKETELTLAS